MFLLHSMFSLPILATCLSYGYKYRDLLSMATDISVPSPPYTFLSQMVSSDFWDYGLPTAACRYFWAFWHSLLIVFRLDLTSPVAIVSTARSGRTSRVALGISTTGNIEKWKKKKCRDKLRATRALADNPGHGPLLRVPSSSGVSPLCLRAYLASHCVQLFQRGTLTLIHQFTAFVSCSVYPDSVRRFCTSEYATCLNVRYDTTVGALFSPGVCDATLQAEQGFCEHARNLLRIHIRSFSRSASPLFPPKRGNTPFGELRKGSTAFVWKNAILKDGGTVPGHFLLGPSKYRCLGIYPFNPVGSRIVDNIGDPQTMLSSSFLARRVLIINQIAKSS